MVATNYPRAKADFDAYKGTHNVEMESRIGVLKEKREALKTEARALGLTLVPLNAEKGFTAEGSVDKLDVKDDADRLIECNLMARIKTQEEAQAAMRFCKE